MELNKAEKLLIKGLRRDKKELWLLVLMPIAIFINAFFMMKYGSSIFTQGDFSSLDLNMKYFIKGLAWFSLGFIQIPMALALAIQSRSGARDSLLLKLFDRVQELDQAGSDT